MQELQIHQVELDMQNEELRQSQGETEAALAKYSDLYDSAPIGYFTFNPQGVILEAISPASGYWRWNGPPSWAPRSYPTLPRHSGLSSGLTCKRSLPPKPDNSAPCS